MQSRILTIAQTDFRKDKRLFGIEQQDRLTHLYLLGQTGTGKTSLIEFMARQDIDANRGCIIIDPHGDLAGSLEVYAQKQNKKLIVVDIADTQSPYGYNPIRPVPIHLRSLLASGIIEVFKKLWQDAWGPRLEHILRNVLLTLLDQRIATLADIPKILTDKDYRNSAIDSITNEHVRNFWLNEFNHYSKRYINESIAPIMNKVGGFLSHPQLADFLTNKKAMLSFRQVMDNEQVLIINLSKGRIGEDAAHLAGSLLMTSIGLAAFSRADTPENKRKPCYLYADEFHNFTTLSIVNMSSELRKYGLSLTYAHQFLEQLSPEIKSAVLGNFGSILCFRVGAEDAEFMAKEFYPCFDQYDLMSLENYHLYIKLMHEGKPSKAFSARTIH